MIKEHIRAPLLSKNPIQYIFQYKKEDTIYRRVVNNLQTLQDHYQRLLILLKRSH